KVVQRFGFLPQNLPRSLSLALGTAAVSPVEIAAGYAAFANGGYKITPHVIQRVVDSTGKVIFETNTPTVCPQCEQLVTQEDAVQTETAPGAAPRIIAPQTAYIMTSI